jgi:hypothetical protein
LLQNATMRKLTLPATCLLVLAAAGCQLLRFPGGDLPSGPPGSSAELLPIVTPTQEPMESVPGLPADPTPEIPPPVY